MVWELRLYDYAEALGANQGIVEASDCPSARANGLKLKRPGFCLFVIPRHEFLLLSYLIS